MTFKRPIIGQEAITSSGLGRVSSFEERFPRQTITVQDYMTNVPTRYCYSNVTLVPIYTSNTKSLDKMKDLFDRLGAAYDRDFSPNHDLSDEEHVNKVYEDMENFLALLG